MRTAVFAAALAIGLSSAAGATTLFSENFNSTAFRGSFLQNDVTDRYGPSVLYYAQNAAGWTFADGFGGGFPHVLIATTTTGSDSDLWLQEIGSSASHAVTGLTVGQRYNVSFLQSGDNVEGGTWNYTVSVGNTPIYLGSGTTLAPGTNPGQTITTSFVATAATQTLTFADATFTSGANVVIDNISVATVPEAATWVMMIAGFGLVGVATRRRRTTVAA